MNYFQVSVFLKILPIAKRSVDLVVDEIEDPKYKALAKQIVKKFGAGFYGKAGSGLTRQGLRGQGLSGSGIRKRQPMPDFDDENMGKLRARPAVVRPAVMPRYGEAIILPERGLKKSGFQQRFSDVVEIGGRNVIKPHPRRMPHFEKRFSRSKRLHGINS